MTRALLCAALLAVVAATAHGATPRSCGMLSIGPGSLHRGRPSGPSCFLKAYQHCQSATFTLSSFGVDTIAKDVFRVVRSGATCHVGVLVSFEVVPQSPHLAHATCRRVRRLSGDIVATGCTGEVVGTISLTGRH